MTHFILEDSCEEDFEGELVKNHFAISFTIDTSSTEFA